MWFQKEIPKVQNEKVWNVSDGRKTEVQKIIELSYDETDSIQLSFYDNGEIDNDTVSIYFNDSIIASSLRLTQIPFNYYITFNKSMKVQKIRLVAENLGFIPPNTALLKVSTRKNQYLITLSSDFSKNGSVEFFLKE